MKKVFRIPLFWLIMLIRMVIRPLYRIWPRNPSRRNILIVCNRVLMADFIAEVCELFKGDERLRFKLFSVFDADRRGAFDRPGAKEDIIRKLPFPLSRRPLAYFRRWDLIITASHASKEMVDSHFCPTLFIHHSMASSKQIADGSYAFNSNAFDRLGRLRYTRMFSAGELNREIAVAMNPAFKDVIAVVGDLRNDRMIAQESRRDEFRKELGFKQNDIVVFVISTWGRGSLFRTIGEELLKEARKLQEEFCFVLSAHPMEYRPKPPGERVWGEYVRTQKLHGFLVREPGEDWTSYLVACDVILTDHTSLALHGAVLGRPIVYVPVSDDLIMEGSITWRLREISPVIKEDASDLRERLLSAINDYSFDKLRKLGRAINPYPGQSAEKIRKETYELLKLEPPA
ncbi:CDP-glycerol glycerophosphotransferase family protein [Planctomycetota bacterium]